MGDPLIVTQIISVLETQLYARESSEGQTQRQVLQNFAQGQIYAARVVSARAGQAVMEIAGSRYQVSGGEQLQAGQEVTVRVQQVAPQLEFELLAERTAEDKLFASALRSLFPGAGSMPEAYQRLSAVISQVLQTPQQQIPEGLLQQIARQLAPIVIQENPEQVATQLQRVLAGYGLEYESELRAEVLGEGAAPKESLGLKQLLSQLLSTLDRAAIETRLESTEIINQFRAMWRGFQDRVLRLIPQENARSLTETGQKIVAQLETALQTTEAETAARQLRAFVNFLRGELQGLARKLAPRESTISERAAEDLLQQVERLLGRQATMHESGRELSRTASELRDRLEALQQLNVQLADRGMYQHLLFPISILNEMTEIQVKQFLAGKDKKGRESLTAVLLLELESIGKIRIDALLQGRSIYVNLFLERPEVVPVAEQLTQELAEQFAASGFTLARLQIQADSRKIDEFHGFDAEILGGEETLIDLQV